MDSTLLTSFLAIIRESRDTCFKNTKQMASITVLIFLLHSLLLLCNYLFLMPRVYSLISREMMMFTNPNSSDSANLLISIIYDIQDLFKIEGLFLLLTSIISLLSSITIITASAIAYGEQQALNAKNLLSRIAKSWRRPVVTWFYITLLDIGYICLGLLIFLPFSFNIMPHSVFWARAYFTMVTLVYVYQAMVWTLALVVSVMEEKCGLEALGKAGQIVKGSRVKGFLLQFLYACVPLVFIMSWNYIVMHRSDTYLLIIVLIIELALTCIIKMFGLMAFTVLYHVCKKTHSEEIELPESFEYGKPSSSPLLSADSP